MSLQRCVAAQCNSTTSTIHRFPNDFKRCQQWADRAGCLHLLEKGVDVLHNDYGLCSDHFDNTSYISSNKKRLSKYALPEIFLKQTDCEPTNTRTERSLEELSNAMCRLCASSNVELVSVFDDKSLELQLLEKIHIHLPIKVTSEDLLPVTICTNCIQKLEMCHEFVLGCLNADTELRKIYGLNDNEENNSLAPQQIETDTDTSQDTQTDPNSLNNIRITSIFHVSESSEQQADNYGIQWEAYNQITPPLNNKVTGNKARTSFLKTAIAADLIDMKESSRNRTKIELDKYQRNTISDSFHDCKEGQKMQFRNTALKENNTRLYRMLCCFENNDDLMSKERIKRRRNHPRVRKTNSTFVGRQILYAYKNPLFQPVVALERLQLLPSYNSEQENISEICLTSSLETQDDDDGATSPVSDVSVPDTNFVAENTGENVTEYVTSEGTNLRRGVIENDGEISLERNKLQNIEDTNPAKIVESIDSIIKRNEEILLGTVRKGVEEPTTPPVELKPSIIERNEEIKRVETPVVSPKELKPSIIKRNVGIILGTVIKRMETPIATPKTLEPITPHKELETSTIKTNEGILLGTAINGVGTPIIPLKEVKPSITKENEEILLGTLIKVVEKPIAPAPELKPSITKRNEGILLGTAIKGVETPISSLKEVKPSITEENGGILLGTLIKIVEKPASPEKLEPKIPKPPVTQLETVWKCSECSLMFSTRKVLQDHIQAKHCVIHPCSHCDMKLNSLKELQHHLSIYHREKRYMCEHCGKYFHLKQSFERHKYTHIPKERKYECHECGKKFVTIQKYELHCNRHNKPSYLCHVCGKTLKSSSNLKRHRLSCGVGRRGGAVRDSSQLPDYSCTFCTKKFKYRRSLDNHIRVHTKEHPFMCAQCGERFRMRYQLSYHMVRHSNLRKHICPKCGKGFYHRHHMRVHLLKHQRPSTFTCDICSYVVPSVPELNAHRMTHNEEEIKSASRTKENTETTPNTGYHVCNTCGKHLATSRSLKDHESLHASDKPFICETCGKCFALETKLEKHQHLHSDKNSFACEICGRKCAGRAALVCHKLVHTGEKPYKCRFCTKTYSTKFFLNIHERVHTGETPYNCNICSRKFHSHNNLKIHLLTHSDNRPFQCNLCHKRFKRQHILSAHLRTHTGERPYSCRICNRAFKQTGDRNKHEQIHFRQ